MTFPQLQNSNHGSGLAHRDYLQSCSEFPLSGLRCFLGSGGFTNARGGGRNVTIYQALLSFFSPFFPCHVPLFARPRRIPSDVPKVQTGKPTSSIWEKKTENGRRTRPAQGNSIFSFFARHKRFLKKQNWCSSGPLVSIFRDRSQLEASTTRPEYPRNGFCSCRFPCSHRLFSCFVFAFFLWRFTDANAAFFWRRSQSSMDTYASKLSFTWGKGAKIDAHSCG